MGMDVMGAFNDGSGWKESPSISSFAGRAIASK